MDAQESSSTKRRFSPEAIPSTGLSVIYEPETDAPIVDIVFVHGLKGHPYKTWRCKQPLENARVKSANSGKEVPKSNTSKRLDFRQIKAFFKGSSISNREGTSLTKSTSNVTPAAETGDLFVFWPADLLPQTCEKARILTFGYDTKITKLTSGPANTNSIFSHGKDFLFSLGRECERDRPIIFIAHSLGGILVKEMLALSSTSDTQTHKSLIESTAAVIFLGTPHRGSPELSAIGEWARSMLSSLKLQTTSAILDTLGLKTTDLERAHEAFCRLWQQYDFQVKTFQESFGLSNIDLGVLGNKVVPHESSLIGDPREHAETLQANHSQMSRFSSAQDPNFIKVAGEIKGFYTAIDKAHSGNSLNPGLTHNLQIKAGQNEISLSDEIESCLNYLDQKVLDDLLAALRFDKMNTRQESILAPAVKTGQWLFRNQKFRRWITTTDARHRLLFIKGKPGAGKSTLMKEAARYMKEGKPGAGKSTLTREAAIFMKRIEGRSDICASFFIDAGGEPLQRCPAGIFRSLLYQLLVQSGICSPVIHKSIERQTLISSIKDAVISTVLPSVEWSESRLQMLLIETLEFLASLGKSVFIFVDALDELGAEMQRRQIDFWSLGHQISDIRGARICLSCRYFPNIAVSGCIELALEVYNQTDILNYITQRINARVSVDDAHWRKELTVKIHNMSSGVFLWVVLVLDEVLEKYDMGISFLGIERLVEEMPIELEKIYEKMLTATAFGDLFLASKMFQWVLAANRPMSLDEWHHILAFIQSQRPESLSQCRRSTTYTENDHQLERRIKHLSRGLLEVSNKQHDILAENNGEVSSINAGAGSLDHEEGSARVVRVIHQSVYDYFIHKGGFQILGLVSENPLADCHCTIVNTCIDYIFILELDDFVVARQRVDMASLASFRSGISVTAEEPPSVGPQKNPRGYQYTFEGLEALHPWKPLEIVENWLAHGALASYTESNTGSTQDSVSRESLGIASQVLGDYPALLVYASTEIMLHIELANLYLNPTEKTKSLIERLKDDAIWKRLRALQQEKRTRKRTAQWLGAIAEDRLPSPENMYKESLALVDGPRSPRSIASFSSASSFSHRSYKSHIDKKERPPGKAELNDRTDG